MSTVNRSAFLDVAGQPFAVRSSTMPQAGPDGIVIRNKAIAINPIDAYQQANGMLVKQFPAVIGNDVAGEAVEVGSNVTRFRKGDRVAGHVWSILTCNVEDGAFTNFSRLPAKNAAVVPEQVAFKDAAVLPLAIDTAAAALFQFMGLPLPSVKPSKTGDVLVVYGASGSVGSMTVQLATAAGVRVIGVAGKHNFDLVRSCGVTDVIDHKSDTDVVTADGKDTFFGVFDTIALESTCKACVAILEELGGGFFPATHKLPKDLPSRIEGRVLLGISEFSFPVWENYVTKGLESGELKCLPKAQVVGTGLESLQAAVEKAGAGMSGTKIVVEF